MSAHRFLSTAVCIAIFCSAACLGAQSAAREPGAERAISRIAFGSCYRTGEPEGVWGAIAAVDPELMLMIGDNVYADTEDMDVMRRVYESLASVEGFAQLRARVPFLATWDDHDYGQNDAGADYPMREEAAEVFFEFWGEPEESERRRTPGVYGAKSFGPPERRVQVILLDTRSFRSALQEGTAGEQVPDPSYGRIGPYVPSSSAEQVMLGEEQWQWLEARLNEPAQLRLIASSIQVVPEDHGFEKWANLPRERQRLLGLLERTEAGGVVFLSGDRHLAEISILDRGEGSYPLIDLTSSSLNAPSRWRNELNRHRHGLVYHGANFGLVEIDWEAPEPRLTLSILADDGRPVLRHDVSLSSLQVDPR